MSTFDSGSCSEQKESKDEVYVKKKSIIGMPHLMTFEY